MYLMTGRILQLEHNVYIFVGRSVQGVETAVLDELCKSHITL